MTKKKTAALPRPRENSPLLFLVLLSVLIFGSFYNFTVLLEGAALALLLLYTVRRGGVLRLPTTLEAFLLYALCAVTLLTLPFSVSGGMAFAGFLRMLVWVLFLLYASTYSREERAAILDAVAWEGAILSLVTIAAFLYDLAAGVPDANGRIDGVFQYANTWSLYLLVCLLLLALREKRNPWDWAAMAVLLCGVFLSGSRGSFLLLLPVGIACGVRYAAGKRRILPLLAILAGVVAVGLLASALSGGMVLRRLEAITLSSSSLNGRILYYLDGLRLLLAHPMGTGRGGYLYLQPLIQTGVYTLKFIHNEYLQAALDSGVLAGLLMLALPLVLFFRKGASFRDRTVIFVIAAHAMIDFDFQFTAVPFLLLLCGGYDRWREIPIPKKAPAAVAGAALTLVFGYFAAVYTLDFTGKAGAAWAMFPADLSLAENKLQSCASVEEAEPVADRIVSSTDLSMVAWDCKFAAAAARGDQPGMVQSRYQYLLLNKYRGEVYEEFTALLENAGDRASQEDAEEYGQRASAAAALLEEVNRTTSPLAYRIADQPDLSFSEGIYTRLDRIAAVN